jgi:hypothetical protein
MRYFAKAIPFLLAISLSIASLAQEACPDIVLDALDSMENACVAIGRNQACYGNGSIVAVDAEGVELSDFAASGDMTEISEISSMSLSGLDEDAGLWGLAVLAVQADIPNTIPGQNVTMLLFGDSELSTVEENPSAFIFSAGIGQLSCDEAPNGLLIQTPEGVGTINLSVNNVAIELGSTAFLTAEADGDFVFALLEGHASLESEESAVEVNGGEFTKIELDEELNPVGEFSEPQPIEENLELPQLPMSALERDISAEATEATEATEETTQISGEIITPREGTWSFDYTALDAAAACPAMMTGAMQAGMNESFTYDFGGEGWDFETFYNEVSEAQGTPATGGTYSSPEPNVYVREAVDNGTPIVFTLTVVSETELHIVQTVDVSEFAAGCIITMEMAITLIE